MFIKSWKKVFLLVVLFFSFFYGNTFAETDFWTEYRGYGVKKVLTKEKFEQGVAKSIDLNDCSVIVKNIIILRKITLNNGSNDLSLSVKYSKETKEGSLVKYGNGSSKKICNFSIWKDNIPDGIQYAIIKNNIKPGDDGSDIYVWKENNVENYCNDINGKWENNKCTAPWNNGYVKKKKEGGGGSGGGNNGDNNGGSGNGNRNGGGDDNGGGGNNSGGDGNGNDDVGSNGGGDGNNSGGNRSGNSDSSGKVNPPAPGSGAPDSNTASAGRNIGLESATTNNENRMFLEDVPGMEELASNTGEGTDPTKMIITYLNWLIRLSVVIGSILAVVYIVIGGVEYMTTTIYSKKSAGKEKIVNAIMGIIFLISGYLIFEEINPNILNLNFGYKPSESSEIEVPNTTTKSNISGDETDPSTDQPIYFTRSANDYVSELQKQDKSGYITKIEDVDVAGLKVKKVSMPSAVKGTLSSPYCLVLHRTHSPNINLERMKKEGYGTQLWVAKDGSVVQVNNLTDRTWHVKGGSQRKGYKEFTNNHCVGIEVVGMWRGGKGDSGYYERPTSKQIQTVRKLAKFIIEQFRLAKSKVSYHGAVSTNKKPHEGVLIYDAVINNVNGNGGGGGSGGGSGNPNNLPGPSSQSIQEKAARDLKRNAYQTAENSTPNIEWVINSAFTEYKWWKGRNECASTSTIERTTKYWKTAGYFFNKCSGQGKPWSAVFISYITNGELKGDSHIYYILASQEGKTKWNYLNPATTKPQRGDMVCRWRNVRSKGQMHCDVVIKIKDRKVYAIGGNVGNTVAYNKYSLLNDRLIKYKGYPWEAVLRRKE